MLLKFRFSCLAAAAALGLCAPALAADYDPPVFVDQAPEYRPVEVGSGWYLRGDVGYQFDESYSDGDGHINSKWLDAPIGYSQDENMVSGSLGIGYHFTDWLRSDTNIGYISGNDIELDYDDGFVEAEADLSNEAWYGLVNLYADLGTYAGLTPYLGGGVGVLRSSYDGEIWIDDGDDRIEASHEERQYSFAYSLNAGLAYHIGNGLSVDLGYQFLSAPDAEYIEAASFEDNNIEEGLDFHQIRLGLRYDLW